MSSPVNAKNSGRIFFNQHMYEMEKLRVLNSHILSNNNEIATILIEELSTEVLSKFDLQSKRTPLQIAIQNSNIYLMKLILYRGVDIYRKNDFGLDAFNYAVKTNNAEIMGTLEHYNTNKDCMNWFCTIS